MKMLKNLIVALLIVLPAISHADGFALFKDPSVSSYSLTMQKVAAYETFFQKLESALKSDPAIVTEQKQVEQGKEEPETVQAMVSILKQHGPKTLALGEDSGLTAEEVLIVPLLLVTIDLNTNLKEKLPESSRKALPPLSESNQKFAVAHATELKKITERLGLSNEWE